MMRKKEIHDLIFAKYGCLVLNPKQVAEILNKSVTTIYRWKARGVFLEYKKDQNSKNGSLQYTIDTVVEYILNYNIKVIK